MEFGVQLIILSAATDEGIEYNYPGRTMYTYRRPIKVAEEQVKLIDELWRKDSLVADVYFVFQEP
jgi:hypothetical protein